MGKDNIQDMFRELNGQSEMSDAELPKEVRKSLNIDEDSESMAHKAFKQKYENLDAVVDEFTIMDFIYFFQEQAKESGKKYSVLNLKKDMSVFKKLRKNYTNIEICNMIKFLFKSSQNYITKQFLQPTILISGWGNRIYTDSVDWVNGVYSPYNKSKSSAASRNVEREWNGTQKKSVLGDWGL